MLCFYFLTYRTSRIVTSIISSHLNGLLAQSLCHSLYPSKLLYKSVTIAIPPKSKITNYKKIYPIYQMCNFNNSHTLNQNIMVINMSLKRSQPFCPYKGKFLFITNRSHAHYMIHLFHHHWYNYINIMKCSNNEPHYIIFFVLLSLTPSTGQIFSFTRFFKTWYSFNIWAGNSWYSL